MKGHGLRGLGWAPEQLRHVRNVRGNVQIYVSREDEKRQIWLQLRHLEPWAGHHGVRHQGIPVPGELAREREREMEREKEKSLEKRGEKQSIDVSYVVCRLVAKGTQLAKQGVQAFSRGQRARSRNREEDESLRL